MKTSHDLTFTTRAQSNIPTMLGMLAIAALSVAVATLAILLHTQAIDRGLTTKAQACSSKCSPAPLGFPGIDYCNAMVNYYISHGFHETDHVPAAIQGPNFTVENVCVESVASINMSAIAVNGKRISLQQKQFVTLSGLVAVGNFATQTLFQSAADNSGTDSQPVAAFPSDQPESAWTNFVGWEHQASPAITYKMESAIAGAGASYTFQLEFDHSGHPKGMEDQYYLQNVKVTKKGSEVGYFHKLNVDVTCDKPLNLANKFNPDTGEFEADGNYDWEGLVVAGIRMRLHFQAESTISTTNHNCQALVLGTGDIVFEQCDGFDPETQLNL